MRRHFHRAGAAAAVDHLAQQTAAPRAPRASCASRSRTSPPMRYATVPSMPHGMPAASKIDGHEIRRRRLAVGAGDADDLHLGARMPIERRGEHAPAPAARRRRPPTARATSAARRLLGHDGDGAAFDRLLHERRAVGVLPFERDEHVAGLHRARVVGDAGHGGVRAAARAPCSSGSARDRAARRAARSTSWLRSSGGRACRRSTSSVAAGRRSPHRAAPPGGGSCDDDEAVARAFARSSRASTSCADRLARAHVHADPAPFRAAPSATRLTTGVGGRRRGVGASARRRGARRAPAAAG